MTDQQWEEIKRNARTKASEKKGSLRHKLRPKDKRKQQRNAR